MRRSPLRAACLVAGAAVACTDDPGLALSLAAEIDLSRCAFGQPFTLESRNDWFPIDVGRQWVLEGEEGRAAVQLTITVLNETVDVGGVTTRVVEEEEREDGVVIEVSRNYFAVAGDATVCYFGEAVDIFSGGGVTHDGAWRADEPGNFPGVFMPSDPRVGVRFRMEGAPGIAEDQAKVVGGGPVEVAAGPFPETIRIRESNPLDHSVGFKVFARGVGLVVDGPVSLVSYSVAAGAGH